VCWPRLRGAEASDAFCLRVLRGCGVLLLPSTCYDHCAEGEQAAAGVGQVAKASETPLGRRLLQAGATNAFYGVGNDINDAELGESDVTAGKLLAHAGLYAALGIGGEAGFALAGKALSPVAEKASDALASLKQKSGDVFDRLLASRSGATAEEVAGARTALETAPESAAPGAWKAAKAEAASQTAENEAANVELLKGQARDLTATANDAMTQVKNLSRVDIPAARGEENASLLVSHDINKVKVGAREALADAQDAIAKIEAAPNKYTATDKIADTKSRLIEAWKGVNSSSSPAEVWDHLNSAKQDISKLMEFNKVTAEPRYADTVKALRQVNHGINMATQDTELFGDAGARQAAVAGAQTKVITSAKAL
jgi:hypothetical protein